jgi:hypothetical protein
MKKAFFLSLFLLIIGLLMHGGIVQSGASHNISGWAWSENIGWISFNNISGGGAIDYGVNIDAAGNFSGYAWSENIGWISFNQSDLTGCPQSPCSATLNIETGAVSGWARALANNSAWDGWIGLNGTGYGLTVSKTTGEFSGWAWGSDVVGWISFNCNNSGKPDTCSTSDYKTITTFAFNAIPVAGFSCDNSGCSGSECNVTNWIAYRPIADPTPCIYKINNDSTDGDGLEDIVKSEWYMKVQGQPDGSYVLKLSCDEVCDYTLQNMTAADYVIKLYVEDAEEESSFITHSLILREEVSAGFMCSLDNTTWSSCGSFTASENELVYFKDDQSLSEHSDPSGGAASISSRTWTKGGTQFSTGTNPSTTIAKNEKTIRLTVVDSNGRTDYIEHLLSIKLNLPEWQEIPPF